MHAATPTILFGRPEHSLTMKQPVNATLSLGHYSIRTPDLEASRAFYTEILGLRVGYRPPFSFRGLWLYAGEDESTYGLVHLIEFDARAAAYLGRSEATQPNTGNFDHIAFQATGWEALKHRCDAQGMPYAERTVPALGLHQVFLRDPSGITIEMNYPAEEGAT